MIIYSKACWSLPSLLGRWYGSALPRTLPFAGLSCTFSVLLFVYARDVLDPVWEHPYPFQAFAYIVGFASIFRCNQAYSRYWEGRTHVQMMTAKWSEVVIQLSYFDNHKVQDSEAHKLFVHRLRHLGSLMHALAMQNLRRDFNLKNLVTFRRNQRPPVVDALHLRKAAKLAVLEEKERLEDALGLGEADMSEEYKRVKAYLGCCGIFGNMMIMSTSKNEQFNSLCPLGVLGGLGPDETKALEPESYGRTVKGHPLPAFFYAPVSHERVPVVYGWIQELISHRKMEGGLLIDPPILSRAYQLLSEGMLAYEQCKKIAMHQFPFPWAQMLLVFLILYSIYQPIMLVAHINNIWLVACLNLLSVGTYWAINEVARDLEDPFEHEPNDFPHMLYQYMFNERILMGTESVSCPILHLHQTEEPGDQKVARAASPAKNELSVDIFDHM